MKKIIGMIVLAAVVTSCTITSPITCTNNPVGSKVGESTTTCVFSAGGIASGIVMNSAYGVADAAKNGGIEKIASVDLKVQNFLFFTKNTLIVTGE